MHRLALLLALSGVACLPQADDLRFVPTQLVPAATGLAAHAQFLCVDGWYVYNPSLEEQEGLWLWEGYDQGAPELTWLEGDTMPEVEGYLEVEDPQDQTLYVVGDSAGQHQIIVRWGSSEDDRASGQVEFEEPAGFGPWLEPWHGWASHALLDGLVLLPGVEGLGSLQILAEDGEALVGDGVATVVQQGSGLEQAAGERVPVMAGRLPVDPSLGDGVTQGIVALEDGRELELPWLRTLDSTDEIDDGWSLGLLDGGDTLVVRLEDPSGHVALVPDAASGWVGPEDHGGAVLVSVDGQPNDGSLGCRAQFLHHPEAGQQRIEVCVGGACDEQFIHGLIDRYDGEDEGCPW